jgi:hypothetical protein
VKYAANGDSTRQAAVVVETMRRPGPERRPEVRCAESLRSARLEGTMSEKE